MGQEGVYLEVPCMLPSSIFSSVPSVSVCVCVCLKRLKRRKTSAFGFTGGTQHFTGTAPNEATNEIEYAAWPAGRTCIFPFLVFPSMATGWVKKPHTSFSRVAIMACGWHPGNRTGGDLANCRSFFSETARASVQIVWRLPQTGYRRLL